MFLFSTVSQSPQKEHLRVNESLYVSYTERDSTYICFFREHCPELHGWRGKPYPGKESPKSKAPQPRRVQLS